MSKPAPTRWRPLTEAATTCADVFTATHQPILQAEVDQIVAAHRTVMNFEAAMAHGAMLADHRADLLQPKFRAGLQAGAVISADEAAEAAGFLAKAKAAFWAGLADVDAVLTLPVPDGPPLIDGTTGYQDWLTPWTVFGGPLICSALGLGPAWSATRRHAGRKTGRGCAAFGDGVGARSTSPPTPTAPIA